MKRKVLKLDVDGWFTDRLLRLCSPAARGFLVDLRCLCVPGGRLVANGKPLTIQQIASLTGSTAAQVNAWFKELAEADAYQTNEQGLYFADMVKDAIFKAGAKVSGAKAKKPKAGPAAHAKPIESPHAGEMLASSLPETKTATPMPPVAAPKPNPVPVAKKPAAWFRTPAGWVRKGQEQAIQMQDGEAYEDFQYRVAKRFPEDGPWLEFMPKSLAKKIRDEIAEGKKNQEEMKKML